MGFQMKIDNEKLKLILQALAEVYPYPPSTDYMDALIKDVGKESDFDGHMLYLADKGLIITDMKWVDGFGGYTISPDKTRISSKGLDHLATL